MTSTAADPRPPLRPRILAAALARGLALAALAAAPAAAQTTFGETADVVAVEVPVQVVRDGKPVRGLSAADFEVFQGRERQALTGFEVIDLAALAAGPTAAAAVPAAGRRHFLLLFDLAFSEPKSIVKARAAARAAVLQSLHPSDLVAVATYTRARGPELALGFTSDRRQIEAAIESLGLPELVDRSPDPLRLTAAAASAALEGSVKPFAASSNAADRKQLVEEYFLEIMERSAQAAERGDRETRRGEITTLARSFSDLALRLAMLPGRKYVVYLSEGFDGSLLTGRNDATGVEEMNRAVEAGEMWKVQSEDRFAGGKAGGDLGRMLEALRRADCVIQAVDIGGVRALADQGTARTGAGNGDDALFRMADGTGGELYRNFNDLGQAMGRMLERTGVTYLLSFQPTVARDGAYHPIEVRLRKAPRGTRIVHRPGYYAPVPAAREDPLTRTLRMADAVLGGREGGELPAAVLAVPFAGEGGKAFVAVLVQAAGEPLLAGSPAGKLPVEIYAYALDPAGSVRDYFAQSLELDLARAEDGILKSGLGFYGHLELPPGDYSLRVLVRNAATGSSGLRTAAVSVPAFGAAPLLLPPVFPTRAGSSFLVREVPRGEQREAAYPFEFRRASFVPSLRPVLAAGGQAVVLVAGYNLGEGEPAAEAEVLDLSGRRLANSEVTLRERDEAAPGAPERRLATFQVPALAPGEYLLRLRLAGAGTASGAVRFAIDSTTREPNGGR